jgi:hypothetical protein
MENGVRRFAIYAGGGDDQLTLPHNAIDLWPMQFFVACAVQGGLPAPRDRPATAPDQQLPAI